MVFRGPEAPITTLTDLGRGRCAVQWVSTVSGEYSVAVTLRGAHVRGSPFTVQSSLGEITTSQCALRAGVSVVTVGEEATFDVLARDQAGNLADY